MPLYATPSPLIDNLQRYARFYLASFLTGMLGLLLALSARFKEEAATPAAALSERPVAVEQPLVASARPERARQAAHFYVLKNIQQSI